jgi:hypothetical protein
MRPFGVLSYPDEGVLRATDSPAGMPDESFRVADESFETGDAHHRPTRDSIGVPAGSGTRSDAS